ncbi:hypothetical protein D3C81_1186140 [compost metagenome]
MRVFLTIIQITDLIDLNRRIASFSIWRSYLNIREPESNRYVITCHFEQLNFASIKNGIAIKNILERNRYMLPLCRNLNVIANIYKRINICFFGMIICIFIEVTIAI